MTDEEFVKSILPEAYAAIDPNGMSYYIVAGPLALDRLTFKYQHPSSAWLIAARKLGWHPGIDRRALPKEAQNG